MRYPVCRQNFSLAKSKKSALGQGPLITDGRNKNEMVVLQKIIWNDKVGIS